jgi:bifunctional ADP-heptose synthase (sugar kinase/adenylyltransferase)
MQTYTCTECAAVHCPQCAGTVWDIAKGSKLHKCWVCGLAFDTPLDVAAELATIRAGIVAECVGTSQIARLQSLVDYIDSDTLLLEWAGVPEGNI